MAFKGKIEFITGGLGGIGYATVNYFLQNNISMLYLVERGFQDILREFGQIDILVNSSGILNENDVEKCLKVNSLGTINICQTALKSMNNQMCGKFETIVNISSLLGVKVKGLPVYCATEHGVIAFTRTLANDVYYKKYGVKFINICPGKTQTSMIDQLCKTLQENGLSKSIDDLVDYEHPIQSAEDCANCIIKIIASGESGWTWSINGGKMKRILLANYCDRVIDIE